VQFIAFLGRFRADNPGVEIKLLDDVPDRLCNLLLKGELDLALMARTSGFPVPLRADPLYSERYVVACFAGNRFAGKDNVPMIELDGEFYFSRINCEFQGVIGCAVVSSSVERNVSLVSVAGRRRSPPIKASAHAVRHYSWPSAPKIRKPVSVPRNDLFST
jgi:hypothetical protein